MKQLRHEQSIKEFGNTLRKVRQRHNFTQELLAIKADIEISQISRIERGVINTSISQVITIANALGVHPKELFDFEIDE
ncbi:MAG: helix-turn-helix transcriptional regulator [Saprospiraceae bacterium]|nr:helix-turn-helix transcriptional regulator [Saprospiraceae bacterium]